MPIPHNGNVSVFAAGAGRRTLNRPAEDGKIAVFAPYRLIFCGISRKLIQGIDLSHADAVREKS
jgi:hypothetical protein